MMEKRYIKLIDKETLSESGSLRRLLFEAPEITAHPGQFVNIEIEGKYLRRPISVSEYSDGKLSLIVAPVGEGTRKLADAPTGTEFDTLTGLGNTFSLNPDADNILLIGGGVGYAPLVGLLDALRRNNPDKKIIAVFGFNGGRDVPLRQLEEMREKYGENTVFFCTMTGEVGEKGNAIEAANKICKDLDFTPGYFYTCGPMPMMKAVCGAFDIPGELSLEARMGCGFGACMGCTIQTADGPRRICREGPVFHRSQLLP